MALRWALISDIHGNLPALEAVLDDIAWQGVDGIACLGDLCWNGGFPRECLDRVRALGGPVIQGNTDRQYSEAHRSAAGEALRQWGLGRLGEDGLAYLEMLPFSHWLDAETLLVHGTARDQNRLVYPGEPEVAFQLEGVAAATVAYGHIHMAFVRRTSRWLLVNPGSVGFSMDGDPRPSYAILAPGAVTIRRVEYDREAYLKACRQRRMPRYDRLARFLREADWHKED